MGVNGRRQREPTSDSNIHIPLSLMNGLPAGFHANRNNCRNVSWAGNFISNNNCLRESPESSREKFQKGENSQLACKPGSVWPRFDPERGSHSSGTTFARRLSQPTRITRPKTGCRPAGAGPALSLFGLAPGGVYLATPVTSGAVGSYPTLSPLPPKRWRSTLCGTFPGVAPAGRYPAPCFCGARTFLTLPSFDIDKARLPGQLARAP